MKQNKSRECESLQAILCSVAENRSKLRQITANTDRVKENCTSRVGGSFSCYLHIFSSLFFLPGAFHLAASDNERLFVLITSSSLRFSRLRKNAASLNKRSASRTDGKGNGNRR